MVIIYLKRTYNGGVSQVITELLERAYQQFDVSKDYSGMGECQLLLAELRQDKATLQKSFDNFGTAQPVANHTGMLECVDTVYKMAAGGNLDFGSCIRLIWGVEKVFDAVRILLQPSTVEDKNRYQLFLSYYGLERSGEEKLVFYPKLKPRFVRMMPKKYVFASKEEKKEEKVYRTASDLVNPLARYLIERTKEWCERVQSYLEIHLPSVMHCATFQEGRVCKDLGNCPFLHSIYTQELTDTALKLLSSQVRLDHALQAGAESLKSIDIMLSELTLSIPQQERMWSSVELLLDFIFPAGLVTYNMSSVLEFCLSVARKPPLYSGVHRQIERYLQYLWRNPGRVGKGKSQNVLKERCKSTAWMVLASLLVPLFKLNIQVDACCKEVEVQLDKERPEWVYKRHKYALLTDQRMVIFLARRHLDALRFLQPDNFDPFEALIKFTKFVKLLLDRREISLFPDMSVFLFWMEVFVTLAICLAAKLRKNGNLFLPGCYPRLLKLFNLTMPSAQRGDLWRMMEQFKPRVSQTLRLLHDRIEVLGLMLYGKQQSAFCLLNHLLNPKKMRNNTFQLAERSIVLALTLLVNVEQGNVPAFCETPIMQCFLGIQLSDNSMIPPRLTMLIAQVQEAVSYRNIMDSLDTSLSALKERAGFFQWRWNEYKAEGLMSLGPANVHAGGPFRHFRPEVLQGDGQGHLGEVPDAMDEIDDVDQRRNMEEEEEIDEEEKAVFQQQLDEAKKEEQKNNAVSVLVRCFRHIRFQKRLKNIRLIYLRQSEKEMFSPFKVTDKMCGICGVSFEVSESTSQGPGMEKGGEEEEEAEDESAVMARMKQEHMNSDEHRIMNREFETFRNVYRQLIVMPLMGIRESLSKMQVRKQRDTWYKDLGYQVDTVLEKIDTLQRQLDQALQDRSWRKRDEIIQQCRELQQFFMEDVRGPVSQHFEMHQKQQMDTAAAKEAEKQHQEKLMDGMVEEPSMADILNVVDQPAYGAGPNAQGGRGFAGGYRGRGRGRGPGGATRGRGRGHGPKRQGQWGGGYRNQGPIGDGHGLKSQGQWGEGYRNQGPVGDGQFEKGDLPPRFRRNQH